MIAEAKYLIIVDAVITGNNPGEISVFSLNELRNSGESGLTLHSSHLIDAINYYYKELLGVFIGIKPFEITFHYGLSQVLKRRMPEILISVKEVLNDIVKGGPLSV